MKQNMKILAVDDNEENLYLIEVMLKSQGYDVILSRNGVEALEELKKTRVNLIISDILMPKMDGYKLIREVKKDENLKSIPFIFYTATYTSKADEKFSLGLGADMFIIKPQEPDVFLKNINDLISKTEKKRQNVEKEGEMDNETYYKIYNERLINKLERRIDQLQEANQALENEINERKKIMKKLEISEKNYRELVESINDVIFIINTSGILTYISPVMERITDYKQDEVLGRDFTQFVHPDDVDEIKASMQRTLAGELEPSEFRIYDKNGDILFVRTSSQPSFENGKLMGLRGVMVDITQRKYDEEKIKKSLKEKEILLKEIHHRVKNNLQIISSLLNLQEDYVKEDPTAVDVLKQSQNRVLSMALLHEMLYQSEDLNQIKISDYIRSLVSNLFDSYGILNNIKTALNLEDTYLNIETAIPLGLIISELVSNSLKYAFPESREGEITVQLTCQDDKFELIISDNGIGLPEEINYKKPKSTLGLRLVHSLVNQLEGTIQLDRTQGKYTITFKEQKYKERI